MTSDDWTRIASETAFRTALTDCALSADGLEFTLHSDNRITGHIDGLPLTGTWEWCGQYFCRTAQLDGEDLGNDCEIIAIRGNEMRYTRDEGRGETSVVSIGPRH